MTTHVRQHGSILAPAEQALLVAIARRLPRWVTSDGLTALALVAMAAAGAGFALGGIDRRWLWLTVGALAVNWFGDSLDGTLARVRRLERPRYGFYVDHVLDLAGTALLLGGLAISTFMTPAIALVVLVCYLLVTAEVFLATSVQGVFRVSWAGVGPTELRLLLAAGAFALQGDPHVPLGPFGQARLFDVAGVVAAGGLALAFAVSAMRVAAALARAEPRKAWTGWAEDVPPRDAP